MNDPAEYSVRLLARHPIAQDTMAFTFERPPGFDFVPGQFVSLQLQDFAAPEDGSDDGERMLSLAGAPHDEHLMVAVRMRDTAFKRHLLHAATGTEGARVTLSPAMGELVLPPGTEQPLVLVAGGIGITPFYSMLRHLQREATAARAVPQVTLLYGNRSAALATWQGELDAMAQGGGFLRVVHVLDDGATRAAGPRSASTTRSGLITAELIRQEVADWQACRYYIVGPGAMVASLQDCLDSLQVAPEQVEVEFFAGY